jgi:hypothetical protein
MNTDDCNLPIMYPCHAICVNNIKSYQLFNTNITTAPRISDTTEDKEPAEMMRCFKAVHAPNMNGIT